MQSLVVSHVDMCVRVQSLVVSHVDLCVRVQSLMVYLFLGQCPAKSPFWIVFQFFDFP